MNLIRTTLLIGIFALLCSPLATYAQETPGNTPQIGNAETPANGIFARGITNSAGSSALPLGPFSMSNLDLSKRENVSAAMQILILLTILSLAPAILLMMTSFTRIIIVLSLLRQALGTQQLPPNQVLIGLAMFMTFLVMGPTWKKVNEQALTPYMRGDLTQAEALSNAEMPLRDFMITQIVNANNDEDVYQFAEAAGQTNIKQWSDVGTFTLIPAFMLSELKTAFLKGFEIYLPFLAVDIVISTVLISMGMMMLPPALISLPFKLLLFVSVDGWRLITFHLIGSFSK